MPVGKGAVPELMVTAEQREMKYHNIGEYENKITLDILLLFNDVLKEYIN